MKRATIKDIAKILGISPSTVSRALKDHPDISEETKKRVIEIAHKLNYRPNLIAQRLKQKRTYTIGVIIPQMVHYFFSSVISGIEDYAYEKGYTVIISQSNEKYDREKNNVNIILSSGAEGVLISRTKETTDFSHFMNFVDYDIPVVFFDRICPNFPADKVVVNDEIAAYQATKYLIQSGCKHIVHFKGPNSLVISHKRYTGYIEALKEFKIPIDPNLIIECDSFEKGAQVTQELLDKGIPFDGLFAVNDDSAAGALVTLQKNGIKVPEQVSIFGYSNSIISRVTSPMLSTVEQPGYEMGYTAAHMLIDRIEGKTTGKHRSEVVSTRLVIRETTKPVENFEF